MTLETPGVTAATHDVSPGPLLRVACRSTGAGGGGRSAHFAWPSGALDLLERELNALGLELLLDVCGEPGPMTVAAEHAPMIWVDPVLAPYAEAYALSTGSTSFRLQDRLPNRATGLLPPVLVADLLSTPLDVLDRAGCLPWSARYAGTSIIHVDHGVVGLRHLVKNLLAYLGLFPYYEGKLVVAPNFSRSRVLQSDQETYLFGPVAPGTLREKLSIGHRHLLMHLHSGPFDAAMGGVVLCSNCAGDGSVLRGTALASTDRVLSCFSGGSCLRGEENPRFPVSAVRANHVFWVGCELVVYGDSLYRSPRAIALLLLGSRDVVSLVAPLRKEYGAFGDLLNACFLLDCEESLGTFRDGANQFGKRARGISRGYLLLGDPRVGAGGGERPGKAKVLELSAGALRAGTRVHAVRQRLLVEDFPRITGPSSLRTRCEPGDTAVLGCILPREDDGGVEATLLMFDPEGRPPGMLSVGVDTTAEPTKQLGRWLRRAGFWRLLILAMREKLSAARAHAGLLDDCTSSLAGISELEHAVQKTLANALQRHEGVVEARSAVDGWMAVLPRLIEAIQPRLLALVLGYAGAIDPRVSLLWIPAGVPIGGSRRVSTLCGCGLPCEAQLYRLPGTGIRRVIYTCTRCGPVLERDSYDRPLRVRLDHPSSVRGTAVTGTLHGIGAVDLPFVLGASLRPEGGADPRLTRVDAGFQIQGPDLKVAFEMHAVRPPSVQPLHLYVVQDLSLRMCVSWLQTSAPESSRPRTRG